MLFRHYPTAVALALLSLSLAMLAACGGAQQSDLQAVSGPEGDVRLKDVAITEVTISDNFWSPRIQTNREHTLKHVYEQLVAAGSLKNFDIKAGKAKGEPAGPFWIDSDLYKWLQGASYHLALEKDPELDALVDEVIAKIAAAQGPDGYVNTWVDLTDRSARWQNLGFFHEMYTAGHMFEAGVAHYQATGKRNFLDVVIKNADYIDSVFGPGKRNGTSGHEEIEIGLIALYRATGEERYLKLAQTLVDRRGQKPSIFKTEYDKLNPNKKYNFLGRMISSRGLHDRLYRHNGEGFDTSYAQDHVPVREQSDAVGHAVRAMYLYTAMADLVYETGDQALLEALHRIHDSVALRRMYVTGGIGPGAHNEGFTDDYDLPNESAYQETCASVGMAVWNQRMLKLSGDSRYSDLIELALYNGLLAAVALEGNTFCYLNPLASKGDFKRSKWFSVPCCPTTLVRTFPRLGEFIYSKSDDGLWVNLYVGGEVTTDVGGAGEVTLRQVTEYPWKGDVKIEVDVADPRDLTLRLRVPAWATGHEIRVNGSGAPAPVHKGYAYLKREWSAGDTIEVSFPTEVQRLKSHPQVAANRGRVALRRGPLIYCLEQADHEADVRQLAVAADAEWQANYDEALLRGVVTLTTKQGYSRDSEGWGRRLYQQAGREELAPAELKAVPYAVWGNRGPGKMAVWLDVL